MQQDENNGTTADIRGMLDRLRANIGAVIVGKNSVIDLALITILCRGHLLIEDVPGLGKTMLARSLARSVDLPYSRVQFTPDLLPSDITGVSIYNQKNGEFEFKPGPVFTSLLLADEINRATPRTQSSLLESMEEGQVTVDGKTYALPSVFMVMATQNPIELQGTFPLPEAQLDRFFMRIKIGYPTIEEETKVMGMQIMRHPIQTLSPVLTGKELLMMQENVSRIHIDGKIFKYIVAIVNATRSHADIALGASPRGSLALMRASQAMALLSGREFVEPHYIKTLAPHVLSHRIIIRPQSRIKGTTENIVLGDILKKVDVPLES